MAVSCSRLEILAPVNFPIFNLHSGVQCRCPSPYGRNPLKLPGCNDLNPCSELRIPPARRPRPVADTIRHSGGAAGQPLKMKKGQKLSLPPPVALAGFELVVERQEGLAGVVNNRACTR